MNVIHNKLFDITNYLRYLIAISENYLQMKISTGCPRFRNITVHLFHKKVDLIEAFAEIRQVLYLMAIETRPAVRRLHQTAPTASQQ